MTNHTLDQVHSAGLYQSNRARMVDLLRTRGIQDARVLKAMSEIPRHLFVPDALAAKAYGDHALPIGDMQTISQPYMVARMTELLELDKDSTVLEIGAGSGYQTAVLSEVAGRVFAIERISELARMAQANIRTPPVRASCAITGTRSAASNVVARSSASALPGIRSS